MRIAVKDASILIDLAEGDLLGLWFQLKIETHTTDLVLREVKQEALWQRVSPFVDAGLLQVHPTAATEIPAVVLFSQAHNISLPDASGVFLARRLKAYLLTGDRRLRRTAEAEEIEAHGLLWILDRLVEHAALARADAAQRLEKMLAAGSRLPPAECATRLRTWRA